MQHMPRPTDFTVLTRATMTPTYSHLAVLDLARLESSSRAEQATFIEEIRTVAYNLGVLCHRSWG